LEGTRFEIQVDPGLSFVFLAYPSFYSKSLSIPLAALSYVAEPADFASEYSADLLRSAQWAFSFERIQRHIINYFLQTADLFSVVDCTAKYTETNNYTHREGRKMTVKKNGNGRNIDPAKLREQAKLLIEKTEQIEREKFIKIGKLTMKHYEKNFQTFDVKQFKKEIEEAL
jgi:hypothetical protein